MKTLFIINPKSGAKKNNDEILNAVAVHFPDADVAFTEYPKHASILAAAGVRQHYDQIIAAGGDGTINEAASALVNTGLPFGVIPKGSGNGFSRMLGLPLNPALAVQSLKTAKKIPCDIGKANENYFINLAGVGIEADIAAAFAQSPRRGMWPYFKIGAKMFFSYKPKKLKVSHDKKTEIMTPVTLVFANGTQYGSNFKIAPEADISDECLDMVEVKNVSRFKLAMAAPFFFFNSFRPLGVTRSTPVKQVVIKYDGDIIYHIDGEPQKAEKTLYISVLPNALTLLVPRAY